MNSIGTVRRSLRDRFIGGYTPRRVMVRAFLLIRVIRILETVFRVRYIGTYDGRFWVTAYRSSRQVNVPPKWRLETSGSYGLARFVRTTPAPPLTMEALRAHYDRGDRKPDAPHAAWCVCEECYQQFAPPLTTLAFRVKVRRFFRG